MTTDFSLIMVQTQAYHSEYANKLYNSFKRNCQMNFQAYCFSDTPQNLIPQITPIPIPQLFYGWWNKMYVYSDLCPEGWLVYLDLDQIIQRDLTDVIEFALKNTQEIACWQDYIHWMNTKFASACVVIKKGTMRHIFNEFIANYPQLRDFPGGDQVWIAPKLKHVLYLDEHFPDLVQSFKFGVLEKRGEEMILSAEKFAKPRIISFNGKPKPHELVHIGLIRDAWQ